MRKSEIDSDQPGPFRIRLLRDRETIASDVERIASDLRRLADGRVPVFIGILKGGVVFLADLIRAYGEDHEVDFLSVARYDPARRDTGSVRVLHDLSTDVSGRLVIVVEAIRTGGAKVAYIDRFLRVHGVQEILYCALVRQKGAAEGGIPLDSWGFEVDDGTYLVGYGLDRGERHRNLPYIGRIDETERPGASG